MNTKKGIERIAKALSVVGWLALGISVLMGFAPSNREIFILFLIIGAVLFTAAQGVVWVIDGFTDSSGDERATLWPLKLHRRGSAAPAARKPTQPPRYDLVGVRGWLLFFVVLLMVLSPLRMITETEKNLSVAMAAIPMITSLPGWHAYEIATWASVATFCAIMVWAGWGLMRYRVPASVRAVLYAVWGVPVLSLFVDMYFASAFLGVDPSSALDATSIGKTIGALFWAGVWTAYFKFSRRVKNTYYEGLQVLGPRAHPVEERREPRL